MFATKSDGTLWGWGTGNNGQVGDGNTFTRYSPIRIGTLTNWSGATIVGGGGGGASHILATKSNGTLWAWGFNSNGQLGDGTTLSRSAPVQIGTLTKWTQPFATPGPTSNTNLYFSSGALKTD